MFCRCANDPDQKKANQNICPICMAHPGTLPVINEAAVEQVLRVGTALGGQLADFTEFDRKNYFYPDIPKGYQISQYKYPLVTGGKLCGVDITRVHLEEDTARSQHDSKIDSSLIDFNRAGVPLMELVTEPVITSAKQAGDFARELQLVLRYLGAGEANMEKGQMRVEANISVRPEGQKEFGTKVEVKNLNSFRSVERAIEYEYCRQVKALEAGETLVQETRGWNEGKQETFSQRKKESSHDYRYFPEPDLPKLYLSKIEKFKNLKATMPELPWEKRARYMEKYNLKAEDAEAYVADPLLAGFFDRVIELLDHEPDLVRLASNYASNDLVKILEGDYSKLDEEKTGAFVGLVKMVSASEITSRGAKDLLVIIAKDGGDPKKLAEEKGLLQKHDEGEIGEIVDRVISANSDIFAKFQAGDEKLLQFLIGQAMKESKGSANPAILTKIFKEKAAN